MPKHQQRIIDSHIHLWDLATGNPPWLLRPVGNFFLGDYALLQKNYLIDDYLADSNGFQVEKVVYLQAGWPRDNLLGEAQWVNSINNGLVGGIVAYANLGHEDAAEQLEALAEIPLVKGIRHTLSWHQNPYYCDCEQDDLRNPTFAENFQLLAANDLSFDLQIYPEQTDQAYSLLKYNPDVQVAIEHVLQPTQHDDETLTEWEKHVAKLATLPNVHMKISGMTLFHHHFNPTVARRIFETSVRHFLPQRCMIGSNFPVEKLNVSFNELFGTYFDIASQYTPKEQDDIFYGTAKGFYRI